MKILTLAVKYEYFNAMRDGSKVEEFREQNAYWAKRLEGKVYDRVVITAGYPKADDTSRRLDLPWRGYRKITITHPHFGNKPLDVYAIRVSETEPDY